MATEKKRITIDVTAEQVEQTDALAHEHGVTRSDVLRWAVRDYIFLQRSTVERTLPPTEHDTISAHRIADVLQPHKV